MIAPKALFDSITRQAEQFRGFRQQDTHELLRFLLDDIISQGVQKYTLVTNEELQTSSVADIFKSIFQGIASIC